MIDDDKLQDHDLQYGKVVGKICDKDLVEVTTQEGTSLVNACGLFNAPKTFNEELAQLGYHPAAGLGCRWDRCYVEVK